MRQVAENDLRQLVSESLRESNDSYTIQELFQLFYYKRNYTLIY